LSARLASFLATWQKPNSPLYEPIFDATLVHDIDERSGDGNAQTFRTSLSIGLPQSLISPDERWVAMQGALDILLPGQWRVWREALIRTMVVCPPEAFVSHICVEWVEQRPAMRVQVKRLRSQTMARYLELVGWPGNLSTTIERAERLFGYADHITLCLDIETAICPPLAFECYLISQSPTESRWAALLDDLVGQGLCSKERRDAFLGWAGMTTPLLTDHDWPDRLIVESLAQPANHLSVIQRRYGSINLACSQQGELRASGALRFVPQWLKLSSTP
jgi:hypothetical protein